MNQSKIYFSKSKNAFLVVPMLIFLTVILIKFGSKFIYLTKNFLPLVAIVFSLGLFTILVLPFLFIFVKSTSKKPAFVLDETGITNLSKLVTWKSISWKNITFLEGFRAGEAGIQGYIAIDLKNQEEFISNQSFLVRIQLRINLWLYGHAILIGTFFLEGHFKKTYTEIKTAWENNR